MKKVITLILMFLLLTEISYSQNIKYTNGSTIYIYQDSTLIGKMPVEHFMENFKNSKHYVEMMDAQKNNRLVVTASTPVVIQTETKEVTYSTTFKVYWQNEKSENINFIEVSAKIEILNPESSLPQWRITYRNIAEFAVIPSILLNVILIILLIL